MATSSAGSAGGSDTAVGVDSCEPGRGCRHSRGERAVQPYHLHTEARSPTPNEDMMRHRLAAIALTTLCACPDSAPVEPARQDTVLIKDLTGFIVVDPTYPEQNPMLHLDVFVGFLPASLAHEDYDRKTSAELVELIVRDPGSDLEMAVPVLMRGVSFATPIVPGNGNTVKLLVDPAPELGNAVFADFCGLTEVEVLVTVRVPECDCTGTLVAPVSFGCREDRRAGHLLELTGAPTPADRPCRFSTGTISVDEIGYDSAGKHIFTDTFVGDSWIMRTVYEYDTRGRLVRTARVSAQTGVLGYELTWTRDAEGRVATSAGRDLVYGESGSSTYAYPNATDWSSVLGDGQAGSRATWSTADGKLVVEDRDETFTATFGRTFVRESWLGTSEVTRLHALELTRVAAPNTTRRLTWEGGRITSDISSAGGFDVSTHWEYDDCE